MKVFGIDVVKGSVRSRSRRPVYALVRMEDGEKVAEGEVTQFRLLKEIRQSSLRSLPLTASRRLPGTSTPSSRSSSTSRRRPALSR